TWIVAAGASAASSIDGLGIRLRVRGSSVSMKPVSRKSPLSPIRQEIPSVGSAIENTTVQPPLWWEKLAIGAVVESLFLGFSPHPTRRPARRPPPPPPLRSPPRAPPPPLLT